MKSIKYLFCALIAAAMVSSCTEDTTFEPGPEDTGAQISFSSTSVSAQLMPTDPTEYEVVVTRANSDEAATYEFELVEASGSEGIFSIVGATDYVVSLEFEQGQNESAVTISFPEAEIGISYKATLTVSGDNVAVYKPTMCDFTVVRQYTWVALSDASGSTAATWVDELLGLYGVSELVAPVTVYEAKELPGYLKVIGLYGDDFFVASTGVSSADFGMYSISETPMEIYIHAEDPDAVWIPYQSTGMIVDPDYGVMCFGSVCEENGFSVSYYGTLVDNVISFDAKTIIVVEDLYPADIYYGNSLGVMGLSLPGAEAVAEVSVSYLGLFADAVAKTDNAVFSFEVNSDTSVVKYALVEGKDVDIDALAAQIADGSIESTELTSFDENVFIEVASDGIYTLVAAPFNGKKTLGTPSSASFKLSSDSSEISVVEGQYSLPIYYSDTEFYDCPIVVYDSGTPDTYYIEGLFEFDGVVYVAEYDEVSQTLSVTPDPDNIGFLSMFAYADEAMTTAYAFIGDGESGSDPWTISVNETGVLSSFDSGALLSVFSLEDGSYLGDAEWVYSGTPITRVEASAVAMTKVSAYNAKSYMSAMISPSVRRLVGQSSSRVLTRVDAQKMK